ncbi:MAG TPA: ribosome biogenesis GTPase Der [Tepidisphaeraceae bacterium]|nr:ribosome biogenesis GTPase Der [Tepidisphaeraceae bacterium]
MPAGKMPVVAIVGRPNVGKSSLLNALVGKRISIVQDMPGVTRDRVSTPYPIGGKWVELVDTGGYGFHDEQGLTEHIKQQIEIAMARADLVLLVVDCEAGLTTADENMASMLRRKDIKTVLIANKADGPKADACLGEFARLGLGTPVGVSAMNDRNLDLLVREVRKHIDLDEAPTEIPEPEMMLAIVGKRNAGKSTLVNAIAEIYEGDPQRVIVSEVPGTTRDSVDVRFQKDTQTLVVIDTAGVRKKRHMVTNDIEFYSFHRAQRSVRRADVVFMLIDGSEHLSEPDKKLAQYIADQHKPVILVVNKWDKVLEAARKQAEERGTTFSDELLTSEFAAYLDQELKHLDYAPMMFTTAKDGRNVQKVLDLAGNLFKQASTRVGTGELNRVVKQIFTERTPSTPRGERVKVYYATQAAVAPPTIVLFVNVPDFVTESYRRFMVNRFRELLPFGEVPIKLEFRGRVKGEHEDELAGDDRERPTKRRPAPAAGRATRGATRGGSRGPKRKPQPKPHPKKAGGRGPARGTRPK